MDEVEKNDEVSSKTWQDREIGVVSECLQWIRRSEKGRT